MCSQFSKESKKSCIFSGFFFQLFLWGRIWWHLWKVLLSPQCFLLKVPNSNSVKILSTSSFPLMFLLYFHVVLWLNKAVKLMPYFCCPLHFLSFLSTLNGSGEKRIMGFLLPLLILMEHFMSYLRFCYPIIYDSDFSSMLEWEDGLLDSSELRYLKTSYLKKKEHLFFVGK